ncbi:hypothetical protein [Streptomyces abikoensis]
MDGPSRGRAGDANAVFEVLVQVGDGVDGGPRGLDVQQMVDAVTAAGGLTG